MHVSWLMARCKAEVGDTGTYSCGGASAAEGSALRGLLQTVSKNVGVFLFSIFLSFIISFVLMCCNLDCLYLELFARHLMHLSVTYLFFALFLILHAAFLLG